MNSKELLSGRHLFRNRPRVVLLGLFVVAGLLVVVENWERAVSWLPWLIVLACPLMHVFMHHGHGRPSTQGRTPPSGDGQGLADSRPGDPPGKPLP